MPCLVLAIGEKAEMKIKRLWDLPVRPLEKDLSNDGFFR